MEMMNPVPPRPDPPPCTAEPSPPPAGEPALADILDIPAIQGMMDQFHALTGFGVGIIDLHGNVLIATGWQDICTKFHRVHPEACKHCLESDATLSSGVELGQFKQARCQNHLWDIVTPIVVGGRHVGNLFLGQFFYTDEVPDLEVFRAQARRYGFAEKEYLAALGRVPRWSREKVAQAMAFYAGFARQLSELGYRNLQLTRTLAAQRQAEEKLESSYALLQLAGETALFGGWSVDLANGRVAWSDEVAAIHGMPAGYSPATPEEGIAYYAPEWRDRIAQAFGACATQGLPYDADMEILTAQGRRRWVRAAGVAVRDPAGNIVKVRGSFQDITARKQAEAQVRLHAQLLESVRESVVASDLEGKILFWNHGAEQLYGYPAHEVLGRPYRDFAGSTTPPEETAFRQEIIARGSWQGEHLQRNRNGECFWTSTFISLVTDDQGRPAGFIGIDQDITARKRAEAALRESQEVFALFMRHSPIYTFIKEVSATQSRVLEASENYQQMIGIPGSQMGGKTMAELFPAEFAAKISADDWAIVSKGQVLKLDEELHGRHYTTIKFPIVREGKTLLAGYTIDITEQKQAEAALQNSERQFKLLFASMGSGFALHEIIVDDAGRPCDYRFLQVNPAFEALTGLQADALIGRTVREVLPQTESVWIERFGQVALTGEPVTFENYSGELGRHYQVTAYRPQPGQFAVLFNDITDLKRAEAALRESEALHRSILNASPDDITVADLDGRVLMVSPMAEKMFRPHPEQPMVGRSVIDFIAPADRARAAADIARMFQGEFSGPGEYRALRDDGSLFDIEVNGEFIRDEAGRPLRMVLVARDTTARKQAEEALRESEQRHRDYLAHSPYGIFVADEGGRVLQVNPAACRMTGFSEKEMLAMTVPDLHGEEGRKEAARHFQTVVREGKATGELKFRPKSGENRWWLVSAVKISATRFLGFCNDITDRKRAEERLRASEEQFRDISTNIPGVIYQLQTGRTGALEVTYMSAACEALFEQSLAGLDFSALLFDRMHAGDRALFQHALAKAAKNMERWNLEFRILPAPDRVKWLRGSANPRKLPSGAVVWSGVLLDITELKLAEQSLREREAFQNLLMDTIPSPVFYKDRQGRYLGFNKAFEAFYGKSKDQLVGKSVFDIAPPELAKIYHEKDAGLLEKPGTQIYEAPMQDAAGHLHDVVFHQASIVDAQGEVTGLIGIILDITERKRAETEILNLSKFPQENPSPVLRVDQAGVVMYSNPPGRALLAKWRIDIGATVPEPWLKRIHQVLESAQLDVRDEEAGDRIFSVSISPVVNSGYVNIYALDITERKRAEEQVTRQLDELRRWQTVTLGREGRVAELKREVNALAVRLGQPPPYPSAEAT